MSILDNVLENIFVIQTNFQKMLGSAIPITSLDIMSSSNINNIKNQILALVDESMEALREIPWKAWKINTSFDIPKFRMELIDVFHFLINLFIFAGMDSNMVLQYFLEKNKINVQRQKDGY